jgi:hypothetical protein
MKYNAAILTALAVGIIPVYATPLQIKARAAENQASPVLSCIQQTNPQFPNGDRPDDQVLRKCMSQAHPKGKRDDATTLMEAEELIYEPDTHPVVTPRGTITDTIQVLGKAMALASSAVCPTSLRNEFVWAHDLQNSAVRVCNDLMADINRKGISELGGVGVVVDQLGFGHNKKGHQLTDNAKLTATWILDILPPPVGVVNDDVKAIAKGVHELCDDAIMRLTANDVGCAQDVKYYRPSKAKHYKDPAAREGTISLSFGSGVEQIAGLSLSFTNDS